MLADFILPGAFIGLVAALSPGPLMALIISETLRAGKWAGIKVAISPILTDVPFVIIAIGISKGIELFPPLLGIISIIGACFLAYLGFQNVRVQPEAFRHSSEGPMPSLMKGILVNLLNPFPYLLWFSVALPVFSRGNTLGSVAYAASLLIISPLVMILIAILTAILRTRLTDYLHWIVRALGILLIFYAFQLARQGIMSFLS